MSQTNSFMHDWGSSLKKFICAIDNKGELKDCESSSKEWLKNLSNTQASQTNSKSSSGGGTTASQGALTQLENSKKILEEKLKALGTALNRNLIQQIKVTVAEALSEQGKKRYEDKSTFLSKWIENWNQKLDEAVKKSQETTKQLNDSYEKLKENYSKWEKIKLNETIIHKHTANVQNFLCSKSSDLKDICTQKIEIN